VLGGAFNCGKGQPGQVAPVSHGCPAVLLRGVRILNTGGRRSGMTTGCGPSPQETVERALAAAKSDDCVVIAEETSTANLRWAGNTLTTNGVAGSRQLTVIAIDRRGAGNGQAPPPAWCPGPVSGPTRSRTWSARPSTRPPRPPPPTTRES
jgi:hypothetical protein